MPSLVRSKWFMGVVLLFAAFGVLAALSILPARLAPWNRDGGSFTPTAYAQTPSGEDFATLERVNRALTSMVSRIGRSVVSIETEVNAPTANRPRGDDREGGPERRRNPLEDLFDFRFDAPDSRPTPREGVGSGVIVSQDGYILTNNHVVEGADRISVHLEDGREAKASLVGRDPRTDIAVIKINEPDLTALPLGDSDNVATGEMVIAIGSPFRLEQSVSMGIVSAKGRSDIVGRGVDPETKPYEDFIQTDAAINPGNSGGPLVNIRGELVGINTAINSVTGVNAGVGFAVPVNMARRVMKDLIEKGRVIRAWLGVYITDVTPDVAQELKLGGVRGAVVSQIQSGSPAEKAGLKPYDIILEADGKPIRNSSQLRNLISATEVGKRVRLKVLRDEKEQDITVTLAQLDEKDVPVARSRGERATANGWMGITVEELTDERAKELEMEGASGVVVTEVAPGSPAERKGIRVGSMILSVGDKEVGNLKEYRDATRAAGDSAMVKWRFENQYGLSVLKKE